MGSDLQERKLPAELVQRECACGCGRWVAVAVRWEGGHELLGRGERRYAQPGTCTMRAYRRKKRAEGS